MRAIRLRRERKPTEAIPKGRSSTNVPKIRSICLSGTFAKIVTGSKLLLHGHYAVSHLTEPEEYIPDMQDTHPFSFSQAGCQLTPQHKSPRAARAFEQGLLTCSCPNAGEPGPRSACCLPHAATPRLEQTG